MSSFTCICGHITPESEEAGHSSGILVSLSVLRDLEAKIARSVVDFISLPTRRSTWLEDRFGSQYPTDISTLEAVEDIIAQAVNASDFSSTFRCSNCGRLAIAEPPARMAWSFFGKDG